MGQDKKINTGFQSNPGGILCCRVTSLLCKTGVFLGVHCLRNQDIGSLCCVPERFAGTRVTGVDNLQRAQWRTRDISRIDDIAILESDALSLCETAPKGAFGNSKLLCPLRVEGTSRPLPDNLEAKGKSSMVDLKGMYSEVLFAEYDARFDSIDGGLEAGAKIDCLLCSLDEVDELGRPVD